jgi:hypothetical protein
MLLVPTPLIQVESRRRRRRRRRRRGRDAGEAGTRESNHLKRRAYYLWRSSMHIRWIHCYI